MSGEDRKLQLQPDPAADGVSTTDYVATLPKRRGSGFAKGRPLFMPRTGMVLTPVAMKSCGSWECVVTIGTKTYTPDGYSLWVGQDEIETGIDLTDLLRAAIEASPASDFDAEAVEYAAASERAKQSPFRFHRPTS